MGAPLIQVCSRCGRSYYPHKIRCRCGSTEFNYKPLEEKGRLVTVTTIYVPPLGFKPPLRVGIAEFPGQGLKLLGRLVEDGVGVGDEVVAVDDGGTILLRSPGHYSD